MDDNDSTRDSDISASTIEDENEEIFILEIEEPAEPVEETTSCEIYPKHSKEEIGYLTKEENLSENDEIPEGDFNDHFIHSNQGTVRYSPIVHESDGESEPEGTTTSKQLRLERERSAKHSNVCVECGKQFPNRNLLVEHIQIHAKERPFVCDLCGKCYTRMIYLANHLTLHGVKRPFCCEVCGKRYKLNADLQEHLRLHYGERPFICNECGKSFSLKSGLRAHYLIHTNVRPFVCGLCGKAFLRKPNLIKHFRVHTGERPHKCDVCHKAFGDKSHLQIHMRIHTGERPYSCDYCGKGFAQKQNRDLHVRTHHEYEFIDMKGLELENNFPV